MSGSRTPQPDIVLVGVDVGDQEVVRAPLGHGEDPVVVLGVQGWLLVETLEVSSDSGEQHVLTLRFRVEPGTAGRATPPAPVRRDLDLAVGPGEVAEPYQRVAAYAVVTSGRGLLMTEFSDLTNAPGQWGLPGGGLDPHEAPADTVRREVWEETGQQVDLTGLAGVQTSHWVGRAPNGRLEDFHAVRIVYRAHCPEPSDPVVHDQGGTTASAAWVDADAVADLPLTGGWRGLLTELGVTPGPAS